MIIKQKNLTCTTEEWLSGLIEQFEAIIFEGDLGICEHNFQIYWGRVNGKRGAETIQPSQGENITLDDFFPTTIGVDFRLKDVRQVAAVLAQECIRAFLGSTKGKQFAIDCDRYYFEKPYNTSNPSPYLWELIDECIAKNTYNKGVFPGYTVKFPEKKKNPNKGSNSVVFHCPDCGLEYKVNKKSLEKIVSGNTPICLCGSRTIRVEEEKKEEKKEEEKLETPGPAAPEESTQAPESPQAASNNKKKSSHRGGGLKKPATPLTTTISDSAATKKKSTNRSTRKKSNDNNKASATETEDG